MSSASSYLLVFSFSTYTQLLFVLPLRLLRLLGYSFSGKLNRNWLHETIPSIKWQVCDNLCSKGSKGKLSFGIVILGWKPTVLVGLPLTSLIQFYIQCVLLLVCFTNNNPSTILVSYCCIMNYPKLSNLNIFYCNFSGSIIQVQLSWVQSLS